MFVVSGEALMDVFDAGATAEGQALDARIGGSPLNVAIGLARLGRPVAFFGGIGTGFLGERLLRALHEEGVDTRPVVRVAAPTTLGLVGLDARGVADYAFYGGDTAADRQLHAVDLARVPAALLYHFGSFDMVVEPVGATLRELARRACTRAVVSYDVNVRLRVEPDLPRWRDVLDEMLGHTHLLKMSDEDFGLLFAGQTAAALAQGWLARGVRAFVLTRSGEGATAWTRHGRIDIAPVPTALVDTVGAGDSFQAALLSQLADRLPKTAAPGAPGERGNAALNSALDALDALGPSDWQAALAYAARAAAITCSRRGADLPRSRDLAAS